MKSVYHTRIDNQNTPFENLLITKFLQNVKKLIEKCYVISYASHRSRNSNTVITFLLIGATIA